MGSPAAAKQPAIKREVEERGLGVKCSFTSLHGADDRRGPVARWGRLGWESGCGHWAPSWPVRPFRAAGRVRAPARRVMVVACRSFVALAVFHCAFRCVSSAVACQILRPWDFFESFFGNYLLCCDLCRQTGVGIVNYRL